MSGAGTNGQVYSMVSKVRPSGEKARPRSDGATILFQICLVWKPSWLITFFFVLNHFWYTIYYLPNILKQCEINFLKSILYV